MLELLRRVPEQSRGYQPVHSEWLVIDANSKKHLYQIVLNHRRFAWGGDQKAVTPINRAVYIRAKWATGANVGAFRPLELLEFLVEIHIDPSPIIRVLRRAGWGEVL